jgi:hypothetical protein
VHPGAGSRPWTRASDLRIWQIFTHNASGRARDFDPGLKPNKKGFSENFDILPKNRGIIRLYRLTLGYGLRSAQLYLNNRRVSAVYLLAIMVEETVGTILAH